jgi:LysM repeat protein
MKKIVKLFVIFLSQIAFAQDFELVRHQVQLGETVRMISRKYKVEPAEIYRLNKFAIDGIRQGMVLQLLVPKKEEILADEVISDPVADASEPETTSSESVVELTTPEEVQHTVGPKETLYSLSRMYNISVDEIRRQNEKLLKRGLQVGQVLTIRRE